MKKLQLLIFMLSIILLAKQSFASAVTATITDSDGQTWNNGTYNIRFIPAQGTAATDYRVASTGLPFTQVFAGTLSNAGVLTVTLTDVQTMNISGGTWEFKICPNASAACGTVNNAVTGATPDLSAVLSAAITAPRFSAGPGAYGYADAEVLTPIITGSTYYRVGVGTRTWSGSAWSTTSGGGTVTGVTGTPPVTSSGGASPAIGCATCAIGPGTSTAGVPAVFASTDGLTLAVGGGTSTYSGSCANLVTAGGTTALFQLGSSSGICTTSVTPSGTAFGVPISHDCTLKNLAAVSSAAGTNANDGQFTVYLAASATTLTCKLGTGTSCVDNTHTAAATAGSVLIISETSQGGSSLANLRASVDCQ